MLQHRPRTGGLRLAIRYGTRAGRRAAARGWARTDRADHLAHRLSRLLLTAACAVRLPDAMGDRGISTVAASRKESGVACRGQG